MTNDKDVYNACMDYCKSFTHLLCVQKEMRRRKFKWDVPVEHELRFAKDYYHSSFERLCEILDEFRFKKEDKM